MNRALKIGFIGLGDQGAPMAVAIAQRYALHVWARREASYDDLGQCDFRRHGTASDLAAESDMVCLCLRGDSDLKNLLAGDLLSSLRPGTTLINHATGDPDEARKFAQICRDRDVAYIDAPVSGGRPGALARNLTCFVGSDPSALARARDVIACHSSSIVRMGEVGSGQAAKLLNNALTVSNLRNVVEVFAMAEAFGVDPASLQTAFANSSGGSFILQALGTKIAPQIAAHIASLNRTDVEEFAHVARKVGCDPEALRSWALAGADGLEAVVSMLSPSR